MRVLWLTPAFWPARGGIETFGLSLALGLRERGLDLLIVTDEGRPAQPADETVTEMRIVRLPAHRALTERNPALLLALQKRLEVLATGFRPQLLHVHLVGATPMALFALRLEQIHGIPMLVTLHDDVRNLRAAPDTLLGRCLRAARWITTDSATFLEDVLCLAPELSDCASAIAPGVPPPATPGRPLDLGTSQFLGLGRITWDKGMDLAVAALAQVVNSHPAARLVLAGDGPAVDALRVQVVASELDGSVYFAGSVDDDERTRLIDASLAVLMPSRHREGFGLVALEAAQRGRAVIAARAGALVETVTQLGNGVLIPQDDIPALVESMCHLLSEPAEAQRLGEVGRARTGQLFRDDMCVGRYLALYQQIAAPRIWAVR